jgi:hypothetical protein
MEEKSWIWTMNCLSQGSENSIHCINVLPLVILKAGSPFKVLFTDESGKLSTVFSPPLDQVEKILKQSLYPSRDPEIKCLQVSGVFFYSKLSKLSEILPNDELLAVQGLKEKEKIYRHSLEFSAGLYTSSLSLFKVSAWVKIDDIALEKFFLVCSINCVNLVEKKMVSLNSFTTSFVQDRLGKFWVEGFSPCAVFRLNIPRPSILNCKIVISSSKNERVKNLSRTQSFEFVGNLQTKVRPRLQITKSKILKFLPERFSIFKEKIKENVCFGTYCELEVVTERIKKHRKVESWKFYNLPHDVIRKVIRKIEFPLKERNFLEIFQSLFKGEDTVAAKKMKNRNDNDSILICPVCFMIYQVASGNFNF